MLAAHEDEHVLVAHRPIYFRSPAPPAPPPEPILQPFTSLEVEDLVALHPSSHRGIHEVSLRVDRGELVVVTGVVGSGKTTLLRAILGLVRADVGTVRWNGAVIDDPGSFLVPPRVAYASQLPRLSSATLRENLVLGWPVNETDVEHALELACLADDVQHMADGLDTLVGPRGMRLSGGQLQRAIAARALVRNPELLVVDDLSSALDVETELALWEGLRDRTEHDLTLLVVSHRPVVLDQADRVIVLEGGRCQPVDAVVG
jgi:ATP-binding cassette subfamily B protein